MKHNVILEEMRVRNGAKQRPDRDAFGKFRADFCQAHGLTQSELTVKLVNDSGGDLAKQWRAEVQGSLNHWCLDCAGYHLPTAEHPLCRLCNSVHAPMPEAIYFHHRGWKFTPPFICMGCGIEVCFHQWAFSRSCGPCDVSNSKTRRNLRGGCFAGPHEKLADWNADKSDIPEDHFIDPKSADEYPVKKGVTSL